MTDTIDVAALVERLRVDAEYLQRDFLGSTAHMIGERAEQAATALQAQADALAANETELDLLRSRVDGLLTAEASLATMREALRGNWHGVFLDSRNEHGSHVLMLRERSIELEQDSNGDFLKQDAERIIAEAERLGFEVGHGVVVTFTEQNDDDIGGYYEFSTISLAMTELLYGSADEQREINRALGGSNAE